MGNTSLAAPGALALRLNPKQLIGGPKMDDGVWNRASNRIFFHFPVSESYNRVDNKIANLVKIRG